jgi:hypothetical protein
MTLPGVDAYEATRASSPGINPSCRSSISTARAASPIKSGTSSTRPPRLKTNLSLRPRRTDESARGICCKTRPLATVGSCRWSTTSSTSSYGSTATDASSKVIWLRSGTLTTVERISLRIAK